MLQGSQPLTRPAIALRFAQGINRSDGRAERALWPATLSHRERRVHAA